MRADWMSKIWTKEDRSMKKLVVILNSGVFGRNGALLCAIVALVLTGLFASSCAKSEIAQDESIANAAAADAAGEGQDDSAGDDQGNSDDPQGDPSDSDSPAQHGSDYISPDHFNMVQMTFGACSDAEEDTRSTGLFSRESALEREEPLDDSVQETFSVKTSLDGSGNILWTQGDKIKVYYAEGESNFTQGTIKHGGESSSTIDAEVNEELTYFYAFYPVGITTSATFETADPKTYGSITVTIPNPQNATDNNFASCHMAVGKASKAEKQFAFSNVGSYLKMQVADLTATSITIKSIAGQNITGTFTVPFTDDDGTIGTPTVDSGSSEITVNLPSGRTSTITIYVMLLPGVNFTKGFLVRYNYSDGITRPSFVYDSGKEVVRRKVLNLGGLDGRIITDWFFKSDGTRTNPSGRESGVTCGSTWDKALNATGLYNLLNANGDADLRKAQAARLDGATLHFANGTYTVPEIALDATGYGENVNLTMYGGYPTGNTGTSTSGRSTNNHLTVISGNKANRIFDMGTKFEVTMDNFEVTEGKVDGSTTTGDGGAIRVLGTSATDCKLTVNQVWFYDNYVEDQPDGAGSGIGAGAGIALKKGTLTATNCIFEKGSARNSGGVLVAGQSGTNKAVATLTNCQFIENETQATCGGGLSAQGGQVTLTNCEFTDNEADCYGGGVHWDASASPNASLLMTDCTFTGNKTKSSVGREGGAFSCQSGTATLSGCTFTENATGNGGTAGAAGGAIWAQGTVNASDCTFTDNYSTRGGGAIWVSTGGATLNLTGTNTFEGNHCTSYVNGSGNTVYGQGGALYIEGGTTTITGATTFQENYAEVFGGAILCSGGSVTIQNSGANRPFFDRNYTTTTSAYTLGAGIYITATSANITLTGVNFDANYMKAVPYHGVTCEGGSIAFESTSATALNFTATDCTFTNSYSSGNTLNNDSSATTRNGAVLRLKVSASNTGAVSFTNCRFTNNRSYNVGGVATHSMGIVSFSDCTFTGNISSAFSGVYHQNNGAATANFTNCTFTGNSITSTNAAHGCGSVCCIEHGTVTMTSCTLSGNTSAGQRAGVIAVDRDGSGTDCSLTLKGTTIEGNSYTYGTKTNLLGGAIYFGKGSLTITSSDGTSSGSKSVIRANTGGSPNGYGLYVASGLTPTLEYCTFDAQNSSGTVSPTSGYAIYYAGTAGTETLTMTGCEIKNFNRATNTGLWWTNLLDVTNHTAASTLSFTGCTFSGHTASGNGGVFNYTSTVPYTISTLSNCTFSGNSATDRGGVFFTDKDLVLSGCTLQNNSAGGDGGSIYVNGGDLTLSNCTVSGNHSDSNGGAILIRNSGSDMLLPEIMRAHPDKCMGAYCIIQMISIMKSPSRSVFSTEIIVLIAPLASIWEPGLS